MDIISFFQKHNIDYKNSKFLLAVSTGVDSMVLLDLFYKLNLNITVLHCNHQKRAESIQEEEFIKNYCHELNIPLHHTKLNIKDQENFQSEARKSRYDFFESIIKENEYLVLAHHGDDLIETILQRIIRGSSLNGYSGFSESYSKKHYHIIRPLINYSKDELYNYAKANYLTYFEDYSNVSNVYFRNRIRSNILPELKKENESIHKKFYEFSSNIKDAFSFINEAKEQILETITENNKINISKFLSIHPFIQKEILFSLLEKYLVSSKVIEEILKIIYTSQKNLQVKFVDKFYFIKEYNYFYFVEEIKNQKLSVIIKECGQYTINDKYTISVSLKNEKNVINLSNLWYNTSGFPFVVRTRENGDKIKLSSGYKKVNDLFIDLKIPKNERDQKLLLLDNSNEVLIIFGVKKSILLKNIEEGEMVFINLN